MSHVNPFVVTNIIEQLYNKYREMTITRGKKHAYIGMNISYNEDKSVVIYIKGYLQEVLDEFTEEINVISTCPAGLYLFQVNEECVKLNKELSILFHRLVAKILFVCT